MVLESFCESYYAIVMNVVSFAERSQKIVGCEVASTSKLTIKIEGKQRRVCGERPRKSPGSIIANLGTYYEENYEELHVVKAHSFARPYPSGGAAGYCGCAPKDQQTLELPHRRYSLANK